tara:strand:+ start:1827 stop:2249 length:423 start_codon:yes stop_codon:yes gene_type:complete
MNFEDINLLTTSRTTRLNGIAFPVIEGTGGFFTKTDGAETIMSGLKQLLLTSRGERVMRPDFGTSLRRSVFEPFTASLKVKLGEEIKATIRKYEPRVDIIDLVISSGSGSQTSGTNHIFITLKFKIKDEITDTQILDIIV